MGRKSKKSKELKS